MSAAVNVFDTLATENDVSGVTGMPVATSASPTLPRQTEPSAKTIAADIPGMPYFARSRSSRASSAARRSGVALGLSRRRDDGSADDVAGRPDGAGVGTMSGPGCVADGARSVGVGFGVGASDGVGSVPAGAEVGDGVGTGAGVDVIAIGPVDASNRGDISQPPIATLAATSAIRDRRAARFTRVGDASCRPHHSATRSPVPSGGDPARRRRVAAPLHRPDGGWSGALGAARAGIGIGRVRHRNSGSPRRRTDRAHTCRQVDRACRDTASRWRTADLARARGQDRLVLAAIADDRLHRHLGRVGRATGRGHRPDRARRSPTT